MTLVARSFSARVVDTSAKISAHEAANLFSVGVGTIGRYIFFGSPRPGDLDEAELDVLTAAGLTVFAIQHVRNPSWRASADLGAADALTAISNAQRAGYASAGGVLSLCLDMEGVGNPGSAAFSHADAWCRSVRAAGYWPVVYVGYDSGLDAAALNSLGGEPAFWADFASLSQRPKPSLGYAMHQQAQTTIAGVNVDPDALLLDGMLYGLGEAPVDALTHPEMPLPFYSADTEPPPKE